MKKSLLIVMTIAVLGGLGLYVQEKPSSSLGGVTSQAGNMQIASSTSGSSNSGSAASSSTSYRDGTYQGRAIDNPYGTVQIAIVVSGGKITDVNFLQMPNDQGNSRQVTAFAKPRLKQETIQKQTARIDFVSGATQTSESYQMSLQAALNQAANA